MNPKKNPSKTSEFEGSENCKGKRIESQNDLLLGILNPFMGAMGSKAGYIAGNALVANAIDRLSAAILTAAYTHQPYYLPSEFLQYFKGFLKGLEPIKEGEAD